MTTAVFPVKNQPAFSALLAGLLIASSISFLIPSDAAAQSSGKVLKGTVTENGHGAAPGTTLNRRDVDKNADPFSGDDEGGQALDVPTNAYKSQSPMKPPKQPTRPLQGNLNDGGYAPMRPQTPMAVPSDLGGTPDEVPMQQTTQQAPPQFNPNDPDSSPDMQLAWDLWHKRVAQVIFERFNFFAKAAFKHSPPLLAQVSYAVTRDGHVTNLNLQQKSTNVLFNVLVFQAVKSLDGDMNVLAFPQGSRRQMVPKFGTFTQNYGAEGFRYTVGDKETVQQRRGR